MQAKSYSPLNTVKDNPWLFAPEPGAAAPMRLYCFPYAGGNAAVFRNWASQLPGIELLAVQYPGRASRFSEPLIDSMECMLEALEEALPLEEKPFAFFGHSMGASIAFELTRRLQETGRPLPSQLIVSGRRAPSAPPRMKNESVPVYLLPKDEFIDRIRQLNGTPEELLKHADLMELMEPILRNDFKLVETLHYQEAPALRVPVYVMSGEDDTHVNADNVRAWQNETELSCHFDSFPGDHFFLHSHEALLLERLKAILPSTQVNSE